MKSFNLRKYAYWSLFLFVTLASSCKKDEPDIKSSCSFTINGNEIYTIDNAAWELMDVYALYYITALQDTDKSVSITLPQIVEKNKTYTEDIVISIDYTGLPAYTSYSDRVSVHITEKTDDVIAFTFEGTFFYVSQGKTVDVEITGKVLAVK